MRAPRAKNRAQKSRGGAAGIGPRVHRKVRAELRWQRRFKRANRDFEIDLGALTRILRKKNQANHRVAVAHTQ